MRATWDAVAALGDGERAALLALLDGHFLGVTAAQFAADLAEKTAVVRLWDGTAVVGFSTFAYRRIAHGDGEIGAVWSGDTIVAPAAWGGALLPAAWLAAVRACHAGRGALAWCLICSGVRTWRLMPVFYREFAPLARDAALQALANRLAASRYGGRFDPATGIVRLPAPQVLRPHLRELPEHLEQDALTREFRARNPGHDRGDELVCATWIADGNLTPAGRRIWRQADRLLGGA